MTAPRGSKTLLVRCGGGDPRSRSDTVDDDVRREREVVVQRLDGEVELLVQHSPALERGAGLPAWRQRGRPQRIVGPAYPLFPVPVTELDRPPQRPPFEVQEVSTPRLRRPPPDRLRRRRVTAGRPPRPGPPPSPCG